MIVIAKYIRERERKKETGRCSKANGWMYCTRRQSFAYSSATVWSSQNRDASRAVLKCDIDIYRGIS